jgi:hypothetical protein
MRRPSVLLLVLAVSLVASALATFALLGRAPAPGAKAAGGVGAKAFARVISNGDLSQSRNVRGVTRPSAGLYCLNLDVAVKNVVASINAVSAVRVVSGGLVVDGVPGGCPNGTDVFVRTFELDGDPVDAPFYVLMH